MTGKLQHQSFRHTEPHLSRLLASPIFHHSDMTHPPARCFFPFDFNVPSVDMVSRAIARQIKAVGETDSAPSNSCVYRFLLILSQPVLAPSQVDSARKELSLSSSILLRIGLPFSLSFFSSVDLACDAWSCRVVPSSLRFTSN